MNWLFDAVYAVLLLFVACGQFYFALDNAAQKRWPVFRTMQMALGVVAIVVAGHLVMP